MFAADISTATLTVKSTNKSGIVVIVDNQRYDLGTNAIMISNLDATDHDVTVYQECENGSVSSFDKIYNQIFQSSVTLKPRTNLVIAFDNCSITMNEIESKTPRIGDNWKAETVYNNENTVKSHSNAVDENEFDRVLWAISKESSEANRMESASQVIKTSYFTTEQVKQLMKLFCSEENKLAIAKLAYEKTIDQSNYYSINDIFKFSSSKDELARCIEK
jgi:hypothetical protein